jgi:cell fate regulator YaaT (PSP1 superfamily)
VPDVVGVVFQNGGKVYYFDPGPLPLVKGEQVVVQTMRGTEIGEVVDPAHEVPEQEVVAPLKRVVRRATPQDIETVASNEDLRREALRVSRELIAQHKLDMKLVDAEIMFGGGKIVISFYAEERVDFRALVADLARVLKMRIELRQIGAREEARMVGGLGPCGRHLCCRSFNVGQDPVSIRMAKEQNLPLNPMKISGLCGRLMCCLKYEQEQYVCFRKTAPKCGTVVETEKGQATVVAYKVPKEALTVRYADGTYADVPLNSCSCGGHPCGDTDASCGGGNGREGEKQGEPATAGRPEAAGLRPPSAPSRTSGPASAPAEHTPTQDPGQGAPGQEAPAESAPAERLVPPQVAGPSAEATDPAPTVENDRVEAAPDASGAESGDTPGGGNGTLATPSSAGSDPAGGDTTEGLELIVSCQAPVWGPGVGVEPGTDIASVEDPPDEPPLGAAQTVVEGEPVIEGEAVGEEQPATAVVLPTTVPAEERDAARSGPLDPAEGQGQRRPRRRRRRKPKSNGGTNGGNGGGRHTDSPDGP